MGAPKIAVPTHHAAAPATGLENRYFLIRTATAGRFRQLPW